VYNGESGKGIIIFALTLTGLVLLILPGLMVWLFSAYNAYTVARMINSGEYPSRPASLSPMALLPVPRSSLSSTRSWLPCFSFHFSCPDWQNMASGQSGAHDTSTEKFTLKV
jgi:hypothetical protein